MARALTIDASGRLVIPRDVRERHLLHAGTRFRLVEEGNKLILEPIEDEALLVEKDGLLVFEGALAGPIPDHRDLRDDRLDRLAGDQK